MSIDTTKPSAELDLAVAQAAGIRAAIQHDRQSQMPRVFCYDGSMAYGRIFRPSYELPHAMEAADKVFPDGWVFSKEPRAPGHLRFNFNPRGRQDAGYDPSDFGSSAPTGPLVICAAILKLAQPRLGNITEDIKELREAGLDAWDEVDDPEKYLRELR